MKPFFSVLAASLIALVGAMYAALTFWVNCPNALIEIYFTQARVPMFTGFLTLGSFLLTLQTAIIQRLKEAYDSADHMRMIRQYRAKGGKIRHYESLENMGVAIATSVILAIVTSGAQMTLGFFKTSWSTAICCSLGVVSIFLVLFLTYQLVLAHREWFKKIEAEKELASKMEDAKTAKETPTS